MHGEHSIPKSKSPALRNSYTNLLLICARCNWSRKASPNQDAEGRLLLDPCTAVWADYFKQINGEIHPLAGDDNALYTCERYGLNDLQKRQIRTRRRDWIEATVTAMLEVFGLETECLDRFIKDSETSTSSDLLEQLATVRGLRTAWKLLLENLELYTPIPSDPDETCRCGHTDYHTIPMVLAEQTVSLGDLLEQAIVRAHKSEPT